MRIVKPAAKVLLFSDIRKQYKHLFAYSDFILYLCSVFVPTIVRLYKSVSAMPEGRYSRILGGTLLPRVPTKKPQGFPIWQQGNGGTLLLHVPQESRKAFLYNGICVRCATPPPFIKGEESPVYAAQLPRPFQGRGYGGGLLETLKLGTPTKHGGELLDTRNTDT